MSIDQSGIIPATELRRPPYTHLYAGIPEGYPPHMRRMRCGLIGGPSRFRNSDDLADVTCPACLRIMGVWD